jgi:hypothetical protein
MLLPADVHALQDWQIVTSPGSLPSSPKWKITAKAVFSGPDVVTGPPANLIAGCFGYPLAPLLCALRVFARSISTPRDLIPKSEMPKHSAQGTPHNGGNGPGYSIPSPDARARLDIAAGT